MFMRTFVTPAIIAGLTVWLVTGCDVGPDRPAPKSARRTKTVKHEPVARQKTTKPAKPAKEIVPGTPEYLDEKNGFRDAMFGQPETEFSNLILKEKDDARQSATYTRTGDVLSLENVPLETIEYTFYKGQLSRITIKWQVQHRESALATPPSSELAVTLATVYGRPKSRSVQKDCTKYSWTGKKVEILMHEFRMAGVAGSVKNGWTIPPTTSGELVMQSIPLRHELEAFLASQTHGGL
jgi:hypothetical protein